MFYASSRINIGVSSFLIDSKFLLHVVCRGEPGGSSLSFASPKESNQRKGDPQSGPLRGSLKKLKEPENLETSLLRSRRTSKFFNPSPSAFSSPAWTGLGLGKFGDSPYLGPLPRGEGANPNPNPDPDPNLFSQPVLAELRSAGGSGNKFLDVRRRRSWLVSKNSAAFEHRKLPEAKRRDPDCGSPFLLLTLLLAKQKKSELPPGNPRHSRKGQQLSNKSAI